MLVAAAGNPRFDALDVLRRRMVGMICTRPRTSLTSVRRTFLATSGVTPLELRDVPTEVSRLGRGMYIFLARRIVRISLLGALILAFIGIFAVA